MMFMSFYLLHRFALLRHGAYLSATTIVLMLAADFALFAAPAVSADVSSVAPAVLLEGRYSGEPLLVPQQIVPLDDQVFGQV
jgi:hypothetical protein